LASSRSRDLRTRAILAAREWFSPERWSVTDALIAVAAVVLAGSILGPWFRATVRFKTSPEIGYLMSPKGSESGIEAHSFLWAVGALALIELAVLIVRNAPDRHALPIPGYHQLMIVISAIICAVVLAGFLWRPTTWPGISQSQLGPFFSLVIGWGFGSVVALGAALVSVGIAVSAIRDR
jgi:hypothetical protein